MKTSSASEPTPPADPQANSAEHALASAHADSDEARSPIAAARSPSADTSLLAYLKWSSLMIVVVVIVAVLATRLLRWLELA